MKPIAVCAWNSRRTGGPLIGLRHKLVGLRHKLKKLVPVPYGKQVLSHCTKEENYGYQRVFPGNGQ